MGARTLVMLSLAALAVRVLYWQEHARSAFFAIPLLDQRYYDRFAHTLVAGGDLSEYGGFRPVLYPFWLSLVYRLGDTTGLPVALFLQHLMGVGTVAMVAVMGARLFRSRAAGVCAGVLYMLAAPPLYFEGELLIASFLTCLLTIVCCGVVTMGRSPSLLRGLWLGGVAGLAAQARPNAIILWLAFAVLTAVAWRCKERARARAGAVALATALVVQALFGFVNAAQSGHYQFITAAGGINFYLGNSRQADGMIPRQERSVTYHGAYRDSIRLFAEQEYHAAMTVQNHPPSNHPAAISHYWRQRGIAEIAAAPGRWVALMAKKSWLLLWNHEVANNKSFTFIQREESPLLRILPVRWWLLLSLAPAGLWLAWRRQPRNAGPVLFLLSVLLAYAATLALFFVNGRFRAPL